MFATEAEVRDCLPIWTVGRGELRATTYIRREMPIGHCIPDVVYVRASEDDRVQWAPRNWTYKHACVIWALRRHAELDMRGLGRLLYEKVDRLDRTVRDLVACGAIEGGGSESLRLSAGVAEMRAEVTAVEIKLHRWREALRQAASYRDFADRVVVAMDEERLGSGGAPLAPFATAGVGLIAVGRASSEWLVEPESDVADGLGPYHDYIIGSALSRRGHTLWLRRND